MKRTLLTTIALLAVLLLQAQTNLGGRVYHHPNIMAEKLNELSKELDQKLDSAIIAAEEKAEKEKGRKLTAEEKAKIDKEVKDAVQKINALKKGMKTSITVEFKDEKKVVFKADMSISDDALKAAGVSWIKRKAMKAALAVAPSSQKGTYEVKGNMVIMSDDEEKDTMYLSADGKKLSGVFDKEMKFTLTRTK